jgi:outer membrane receptor protein involved in Fe transport
VAAGSWGPRLGQGATAYDNRDNIFQTGLVSDNTISASGGTERTTFFLSAGLLDQRGIVVGPNNEFERYSVRFNGGHQVFNTLRVGVNANYVTSQGAFVQSRNNVGGLLLGAWRTPVDFNNEEYLSATSGLHRSYRFPNPAAGSERTTRRYDNPFFAAYVPRATSDVGRAFGNITAEYIPTSWLRVNYSLGSDFSNDERLESTPLSSSTGATAGQGQVIRASMRNVQIDHNLSATGNYTLTENVRGTVTLGQNLNAQQFRQQAGQGNVLVAAEPYNLGNTSTQQPPSDLRSEVRIESYFGQATVDLFEQLFLTLALRNDGFSTFGANSRRAWFPKGSASWSFLREPGMTNGMLTFGKVRAAYGQSGTSPTAYQTQTVFSSGSFFEGGWGPTLGTQQNGVRGLATSTTLGNPDLGPERVGELEMGFDLGLLRDRADLTLTHYRQKTTDAILQFPLQAAGGYTTQLRNVGELENIGWEAALNLHPLRGQRATWDVGLFWSRNRNKVLSLQGAAQVVLNAPFGTGSFPQAIVREGQPMGIWLSDDFIRCGRGLTVSGVQIDQTSGHCQGAPAGALYLGADGLPLRDQEDQYLLADANPDWQGGVRTNLTWRKFTFGGLLDMRRGGDVWNGTRTALNHFGRTAESARFREGTFTFGETYVPDERVAGPGVGKAVALGEGWFSGLGGVFNGPASFAFEDGSFMKLRELSVGYLWDTQTVRRIGFSNVEFRVAGRNLYTWTDYTGVDPETSVQSAGTSVIRGVDYFNNPQTRSFVFTLSLNR